MRGTITWFFNVSLQHLPCPVHGKAATQLLCSNSQLWLFCNTGKAQKANLVAWGTFVVELAKYADAVVCV